MARSGEQPFGSEMRSQHSPEISKNVCAPVKQQGADGELWSMPFYDFLIFPETASLWLVTGDWDVFVISHNER